jgi:2-polyprenyl-3-methyl-5-hydroxy-6-metoxy-1,4-benzoquinol methylase
MNTKADPLLYEKLVAEHKEIYPSITLPSEFAGLFQENTLQLLIKLARYKFAARLLKSTDQVLEVGSGNGVGTIFLGQHVKKVTGLEIREHEFLDAQIINQRKNVDFINQSVFEFFPELQFDAIVSLDVIEHLTESDGEKFVQKLASLCKPDGVVIIGTPSIHSLPYQGAFSQASHIKCYDRYELDNLFGKFFLRTLPFSMNDEVVHTGHPKMAWYYFSLGLLPKH